KAVRKFSSIGSVNYVENGAGRLETRDIDAELGVELQNSDKLTASYNWWYEYLPLPFTIGPRVTLPVGAYDYGISRLSYLFGPQRPVNGTVALESGTFYGGHRTTLGVSGSRVELAAQFS